MVNKHRISIKSNRTRCSAISGARSSNAGTGLKVLLLVGVLVGVWV